MNMDTTFLCVIAIQLILVQYWLSKIHEELQRRNDNEEDFRDVSGPHSHNPSR